MTEKIQSDLNTVNREVNSSVTATSDLKLYGEDEHWAYPNGKGDCEDIVLAKKLKLVGLGYSPGALLITVVRDELSRGHAVLTVATSDGDYILDNRRNEVLLWNRTLYIFVERQSHSDPMRWVSLSKDQLKQDLVYVARPLALSAK